jgi:hypothetical protein
MFRRLIITSATAVVLAGGLTATAEAAPVQVPAAATCHAHRSGNHWVCVTPGSYCPAAAHRKYGVAKAKYTHKRYRCSYYGSDGRWHWKRA